MARAPAFGGKPRTAVNVALWRGAYPSRSISASGLQIGGVTIQNTLRRVAGPPVFLMIDVGGVDTKVADELEAELDAGAADGTTGTIGYTAAAVGGLPAAPTGTYNVSYGIPVNRAWASRFPRRTLRPRGPPDPRRGPVNA